VCFSLKFSSGNLAPYMLLLYFTLALEPYQCTDLYVPASAVTRRKVTFSIVSTASLFRAC
jgi:hypothetical protein